MSDIFISYSRQDLESMVEIYRYLREAGFRVWIDILGIPPYANSWAKAIDEAINNAKCVFVLISPHSVVSKWVQRELALAEDLNKPTVLIQVSGTQTASIMWSAGQKLDITGLTPEEKKERFEVRLFPYLKNDLKCTLNEVDDNLKRQIKEDIRSIRSSKKEENIKKDIKSIKIFKKESDIHDNIQKTDTDTKPVKLKRRYFLTISFIIFWLITAGLLINLRANIYPEISNTPQSTIETSINEPEKLKNIKVSSPIAFVSDNEVFVRENSIERRIEDIEGVKSNPIIFVENNLLLAYILEVSNGQIYIRLINLENDRKLNINISDNIKINANSNITYSKSLSMLIFSGIDNSGEQNLYGFDINSPDYVHLLVRNAYNPTSIEGIPAFLFTQNQGNSSKIFLWASGITIDKPLINSANITCVSSISERVEYDWRIWILCDNNSIYSTYLYNTTTPIKIDFEKINFDIINLGLGISIGELFLGDGENIYLYNLEENTANIHETNIQRIFILNQ